jgi:hypothetical protein
MLTTILIVTLILLLIGAFPRGPWYGASGASWGYYPSGLIGLILLILILFLLFDHGRLYAP